MTKKKISSLLFACVLALLACSDDSSNGVSATDEKSSSSAITGISSEGQKIKSSSSENAPESSSEKSEPASSSQKTETSSSSETAEPSSSESADPASSAAKIKDWRDTCLDIINEYRSSENLEPLARATDEKLACTDKQAADDLSENSPHGHFKVCGEMAQNSGPNVSMYASRSYSDYVQMYLKMMWEDEKALVISGQVDPDNDDDYSKIGHYLNMKDDFKSVACGFAESVDGKKGWLNINFFR